MGGLFFGGFFRLGGGFRFRLFFFNRREAAGTHRGRGPGTGGVEEKKKTG